MFSFEIENKIISFIKNSPLGVTSSEIAKNVGLNRMTMTKYLAIIRERDLIDFKQLGMAKLWYIPVNITKESFLSKIVADMTLVMPENEFKAISEKIGVNLGEEINNMYLSFNGVKKLSFDQIVSSYEDIGKKIGGIFKTKIASEKISIEIVKPPFEQSNAKAINKILSAVFAKIAASNLGYVRVVVLEPQDQNAAIELYLKKEEGKLQ